MLRKVILWTLLSFTAVAMYSCKKMDSTFEQYIQKGGRLYAGRPVNVKVSGGLNRVMIYWPRGADASIVKARVYWNLNADSLEVPVTANMDTVKCIIENLAEKDYSFTIRTYDKEGSQSVPLEVFGSVYGQKYRARLLDRPVISSEQRKNGEMFIAWGEADTLLGAFATELKYVKSNGDTAWKQVDVKTDTTVFADYKTGTNYHYRTLFLPAKAALDTFRTNFSKQEVVEYVPPLKIDLSSRYLQNYTVPFQRASYDGGRWGTLAGWTTNAAAMNQGPAGNKVYGGYDNINNSASLGTQKWGAGDPAIPNGKIYQTIELPAGDYEVIWSTDGNSGAVNRGTDPRYLVIAAGNTLPDIGNLSTALASVSFVTSADRFSVKASFSLSGRSTVSLGILINFVQGQQAFRGGNFRLWGPDL